MEFFAGMGIGAIIVFIIVPILIGALFLYLGASIAGIENKSFGKAIGAFVLSWLVVAIISAIFSFFPVVGSILGFIVGIILSVLIIKSIFKTSSGKAFIALLLAWVLYVISGFILALVFGVSLAGMMAA
jgi:hypothetical protein